MPVVIDVNEVAQVFDPERAQQHILDTINQRANEYFRAQRPTWEQVKTYVEGLLPDLAKQLGPEAEIELEDRRDMDPAQEAAERLAGTFDLSALTFKATVRVQKPVEFVTIQFTVNEGEK